MSVNDDRNRPTGVTRRGFLKVSTAVAAAASVPTFLVPRAAGATDTGMNPPDPVESADGFIYSVCQMCHSRCGIRAKVVDGVLVRIQGNPYHPNTLEWPERLPYATDPASDLAQKTVGRLCPRGNAGVQTLYDPFRVKQPLKRVGARGSGKWEPISWAQAFAEIADSIKELIPDPTELIDPAYPDLGTKANQLAFSPGRSTEKEVSERFWKYAWGTANYDLAHTSICESSRHVAIELVTGSSTGDKVKKGGVNFFAGSNGCNADVLGAEFILLVGMNPMEAMFPMQAYARKLVTMKATGGKFWHVDPRFNKTSAAADRWIPIAPGGDAAFGMGILRWMFDNAAYDATYLENPNQAAADADGEPTFSDASYLIGEVQDDEGRKAWRYVKTFMLDDGQGGTAGALPDAPWHGSNVVWSGDSVTGGPADATVAQGGALELPFDGGETVLDLWPDGDPSKPKVPVVVRTVLSALRSRAEEKTTDGWSSLCGLPPKVITEVAAELTSHGKRARVDTYRGPVKHTNGVYNQLVYMAINTLLGNYGWRGGLSKGGGSYSATSGVASIKVVATALSNHEGTRLDRAKEFYEDTNIAKAEGWPPRRPWFPFATHGTYQEIVPSIQDQYPYPMKVLITYWNALPYSTPALKATWEQVVSDPSKLPLLVSISPVMGEVAAYADYVLPDTVYLEKFSVPGGLPAITTKFQCFQQPVVGKYDGKGIGLSKSKGGAGHSIDLTATNEYTPLFPGTKAVMDIHIGLIKALEARFPGQLSATGADALGLGRPLDRAFDIAKAELENIAKNAAADFPAITPAEILAKGGVFKDGDGWTGDYLGDAKFKGRMNLMAEPLSWALDTWSGAKYFDPLPHWEPTGGMDGAPIKDNQKGYPFRLVTFKSVYHGQGRTAVNPWLMMLQPENWVELNTADAKSLGVTTGDRVRLISPSNPQGVVGKVKSTEAIRPGVVGVSHHFGHWELGSKPWKEWSASKGEWVKVTGDPSRGAGVTVNPIMRTDTAYPNVSLQDKVGGSCSFFDTWINVIPLGA